MSNFFKKHKQKIIIAATTVVMGMTGATMLPMTQVQATGTTVANNGTLTTDKPVVETPETTVDGKDLGKVLAGDEIQFKIRSKSPILLFRYQKDRFNKSASYIPIDVKESENQRDGEEYTYVYTYTIPQGEKGLHELCVTATNKVGNPSSLMRITYYVVDSFTGEDKTPPVKTTLPVSGSNVLLSQKTVTIGITDETELYYAYYKWASEEEINNLLTSAGETELDSYLKKNSSYYTDSKAKKIWYSNWHDSSYNSDKEKLSIAANGEYRLDLTLPGVGNWYLFVCSRDGANNLADGQYLRLHVRNDFTAPTITLNRPNPEYIRLDLGNTYNENRDGAYATAFDAYDNENKDVSFEIRNEAGEIVTDSVINTVGKYTVTYTAEADNDGNIAEPVERTVYVVDYTELNEAIRAAELMEEEEFTAKSWEISKIKEVLEESQTMVQNNTSNQDAINEQRQKLDNAMDKLVVIPKVKDIVATSVNGSSIIKDGDKITIRFTTQYLKEGLDKTNTTVKINGKEVTVAINTVEQNINKNTNTYEFTYTLLKADGDGVISIQITPAISVNYEGETELTLEKGVEVSKTSDITLDTEAPIVEFSSENIKEVETLEYGQTITVNKNDIIVDGKSAVETDATISITINDVEINEKELTELGTYTVKYKVTDVAGNETIKTRTITIGQATINETISGLTIGELTENYLVYNGNPKTITAEVNDNATITSIIYYQKDSNNNYVEMTGENNIPVNAGDYKAIVTVTGKGNYTGSFEKEVVYSITKADPEYSVPQDIKAVYGDTLAEIEAKLAGTRFSIDTDQNELETSVGNAGTTKIVKVKYTPEDTNNYNIMTDITLNVEVGKADPLVPMVPTGLKAEYGDTLAKIEEQLTGTGFSIDTSKNTLETPVGNVGNNTFAIIFTPEDTDNYNVVTDLEITVKVGDTVPPVLTIDGEELIVIKKGESYTLPTVTATDNVDGNVAVTNDSDKIDTKVAGEYTITFSAKDSNDNIGTATITLRVLDLDALKREEVKISDLEHFATEDVFDALNENKNDYTEESFNARKEKIAEVKAEIDNILAGKSEITLEELTQEFVNAKIAEIENTVLQPKELNKEQYEELMNRELVESDYTPETWAALEAARTQDITNVTLQSELNVISYRIQGAIRDLETIDFRQHVNTSTTKLYMKLSTDYVRSDYTQESYQAATDALFAPAYETIYYPQYPGNNNLKSVFDKKIAEVDFDKILVAKDVNQSALDAIEEAMSKLNKANYTQESWDALEAKIAEARKITDLQSKFDNAMKDISLDSLILAIVDLTDENVAITIPQDVVFDGAVKEIANKDIDVKVTVNGEERTLTEGTDYEIKTVTYTGTELNAEGKPVNAGNYEVEITIEGKGIYAGTVVKSNIAYPISKKTIEGAEINKTVPDTDIYGTVTGITINEIKLADGTKLAVSDYDAKITYTKGNTTIVVDAEHTDLPTEAGTYTVKIEITGKGNYEGTVVEENINYVISQKTIELENITLNVPEGITGTVTEPSVVIPSVEENENLVEGTDYTVVYTYAKQDGTILTEAPTEKGDYTVTATITILNDNYASEVGTNTIEKTADYSIGQKIVTPEDITLTATSVVYGENSVKTIEVAGVNGNLVEGTDYEVEYTYAVAGTTNFTGIVPTDVGNYIVKATVKSLNENYSTGENGVEKTAEYTISAKEIKSEDIILTAPSGNFGNVSTALVTVPGVNGNLAEGTDYTVVYTYAKQDGTILDVVPTDAGNYTVTATITMVNTNYALETKEVVKSENYVIGAKTIEGAEINKTVPDTDIYGTVTGITINEIKLADGTKLAVSDYDAKITYTKGNTTIVVDAEHTDLPTEAGTYTVKIEITGKGNYEGTVVEENINYVIAPKTINTSDIILTAPTGTIGEMTEPSVTVEGLAESDYTVEYKYAVAGTENFDTTIPTEAGKYTVKAIITITNTNYASEAGTNTIEKTADYEIGLKVIEEADVTFNFPGEALDETYNGVEYNGKGHTATATVSKDGKDLIENTDYKVTVLYTKWDGELKQYVELPEGELPTEIGAYGITVTVEGINEYKGKVTKRQFVRVQQATIEEADVEFIFPGEALDETYNGVEYNGKGHTATAEVSKDGKDLVENTDYKVTVLYTKWNGELRQYVELPEGELPTEVGAYGITVTVEGINEYKGKVTKRQFVRVQQTRIEEADVEFIFPGEALDETYNGVEYNGKGHTATATVTKNKGQEDEFKISENDYKVTVVYTKWDAEARKYVELPEGELPTEIGAYGITVTVEGKNNCSGKVAKKQFVRIQQATIEETDVTFDFPGEALDETYNGVEYREEGYTASATVSKNGNTLEEGTDYTLETRYTVWNAENRVYEPLPEGQIPTAAGTYRMVVIVRGAGNYKGTVMGDRYVRIQAPKSYTVTFNNEDGTKIIDKVASENNGYKVTELPTVTKEGYNFLGWFYTENEEEKQFTLDTIVSGDMTVEAKFEVNTVTVTFKNGEETVATKTTTVEEGYVVEFPADLTKEGYTFLGWFVGEDKVTAETEFKANTTVEAKFEVNTVTVTFKNGEETVATKTTTVEEGYTVEFPADLTKEGYTFLGWFVGEDKVTAETEFKANTTVEAKFEVNTVTVTFKNGEETVATKTTTVEEGYTVEFPADLTKEGYTFLGWFVGEDKVTAETEFKANTTVEAKFEVNTVTVTFKNGEETVATKTTTVEEGYVVEFPADLTKEGYTFLGWFVGEDKVTAETEFKANTTVEAKFEVNTVTVTFKNGEETVATKTTTVEEGYTVEFPADLSKEGYTFLGWFVGEDKVTAETEFKANTTVEAKFEVNTVTVTFKNGEETVATKTTTVEEGYTVEFPADLTKEGYTFLGWFVGEDKVTAETEFKANTTVEAKFEVNTVTVTFKNGEETVATKTTTVEEGYTVEFPADLTKEGYTFLGWFVGEDKVTAETEFKANTTVEAKFEVNTVTVTFKNGEETVATKTTTVEEGYVVEFPADLSKEGYTFLGWFVGEDKVTAETEFKANTTVEAKFTARTDIAYIVKYVDSEGKELKPTKTVENKTFGEVVTENAETVEGYNVDEASKSITLKVSDNEIKFIYTKRTDLSYTIKYVDNKGTEIKNAEIIEGQTFGDSITVEPANIDGYLKPISQDITIEVSGNEVTFTYVALPTVTDMTYSGNTLGDIELDDNWEWLETDKDTKLTVGEKSFKAQYIGQNQENYLNKVVDVTFTINAKAVTVKANDLSKVYGESDPELTATVTGLVEGESEDLISYNVTRAAGEDKGTYTITASGNAEQGNYEVTFEEGTFTINAKAVTVKANDLSKVYGESDPELTATVTGLVEGESEDLISYNVTRAAGEDKGTYTITASGNAEQGNYEVTFEEGTFTINAKAVTVKANDLSKVYGENDPELTATVTGLVEGESEDLISYTVTRAAGENKGTYTITASGNAEQGNYEVTFEEGTFTINAKAVTVKANDLSKVYGENDPELTATVTGLVEGESEDLISYNVTRAAGEDKGTYTITASGNAEQGNYEVTFEEGTFTINAKAVTVKANDLSKVYGESDPELTATVTGLVEGESEDLISYNVTRAAGEDKGTYTITASGNAEQGNYEVTFEEGTFTINAKAVTVKANDLSKVYGESDPELTATVTGLVEGESEDLISYTVTRAAGENKGTYTITASGNAEQGNYEVTFEEGTFTINAKAVTVKANNARKVYGENDPELTATVTGLVEGESEDLISYNVTRAAGENKGTYTITASGNAEQGNYEVTFEEGTFTINAKAVTVKANNASKVYGENDPELTATVTGLVEGESEDLISYNVTRVAGENKGTYTITASGNAEQGNYEVTFEEGTFTINAKAVTVKANNASKVYGENDPELTATVTGLVEGESEDLISYNVTRAAGEDKGTYTITASGNAEQGNYEVTFEEGTFTINAKAVTVKANDLSKVYGENDPELTATVTGLVEGESEDLINYTVTRAAGENKGTYTITAAGNAEQGNYEVTFEEGTFTINAKAVTVKANDLSKVYGENDPELTATVTGLVEGESEDLISYTVTRAAGENKGTYTITASGNAEQGNYEVTFEEGTFTINAKAVTVKANDLSKVYGESDPELTATVTGLVEGESEDLISYTVTRAAGENKGTYTITASGNAEQGNYEVTFEEGTFTINAKAVTVKANDLSKVYGESDPELTATVTGLVEGESEDLINYTVTRAEGEDKGTYTITAAGEVEQGNYEVTFEEGTFTINAKAVTVKANNASKVYGENDPELTATVTGLVEGESEDLISYNVTRAAGEDKGTYTITASGNAEQGNYEVTFEEGTFTINAKAVTVKANNASKVYGENDPELTATVTGLVEGESEDLISYNVTRAAGEDKGTYTITASGNAEQGNYEVTFEEGTFTINAKAVTVKANDLSKVYGESDPELTATVTGLVEGESEDLISYNVTRAAGEDKGTYTITAAGNAEQGNYEVTFEEGTFTINAKAVTVKANDLSKVYGESDPELTATVTGLVEGESEDLINYTVTRAAGENKGTYTITAAGNAEQGNYEVTFEEGTFTINAKAVTVKANDLSKVYGENDPELTATVTGLVEGESEDLINYTVTRAAGENKGTYTITAAGNAEQGNYEVTFEEGTFTINAKAVTVKANDLSKVYGENDPELTATVTGLVEGESEDLISYTVTRAAGENKGTYTITASGNAEQGNYEVTFEEGTFTINAKAVTVKANDLSKVYGENDPELTATVTGLVEGESEDLISYNVTRAAGEDKGTYTITASGNAEQGNYEVTFEEGTFTINAKAVTVKANDLSKVYGESDPELTATVTGLVEGESEDLINYTVTRAAGENKGTYTITASGNAEQGNYEVTFEEGTFTINAKAVTVKANDLSKVYGESDPELTATVTGLVEGESEDLISYTVTRAAGENKGTYTITAAGNAEQGNYEVTFEEGTFTINAKAVTVKANDLSKVYGENDPELTATVTGLVEGESEDLISYTVTRAAGENKGTYTITASGNAEQGNYEVTFEEGTFTINAKAVTVKANNASKVYGESDPELTATVTGLVEGESEDLISYNVTRAAGEDKGTYTITASGNAEQGNYEVTFEEGTFTINAKAVTVKANDLSKVYGESDPELTATVTGLVEGESEDLISYTVTRAAGENKGTYTITASGNAEQGNYEVTFEEGTFTINAKAVTVKANDLSKVYGESDPELTATVTGLVEGESEDLISYTVTRAAGENKGTYTITAAGNAEQGNYEVTFEEGTFTINAKAVTVKANDLSKVYGENDPELTATVTGLVEGESEDLISYNVTRAAGEDKGTYTITAAGNAEQGNYEVTFEEGTFTINAKAVTVKANNASKVYGESDPELTATVTGLVEGESEDLISYNVTRAAGENKGTYTITVSGNAEQGNYEVTFEEGTFTINAKAVTVKANDLSKVYGESDPELTATVTGLVEGESEDLISYNVTRAAGEDKGTYTITASGNAEQGNYEVTFEEGTFTINAKAVTVKANDLSKVYGESDPELTATVTGLVEGESEDLISYTVTRAAGENKGTYTITASGNAEQGNYEVTFEEGTFTINAKAVTVKANDLSKVYGESDPELTATVTGLVEGESEDLISYTVTRAAGENKGTYTITAAGNAEQGNYEVTFEEGTFTINAKAVTVKANDLSKVYGENDPELTATVTGLVEGESEDLISYNVTRAAGEDKGTYTITAAGNAEQGNYEVTFEEGTFTINAKAVTVKANNASKVYGESDPELTATVTGLVEGESEDLISYNVTRAAGENKGTYTITVSGNAEQGNYEVTFEEGTFTINAKAVTVKANDLSKVYGESDPELTATVTGLVEGESEDLINYTVTRAEGEDKGTYTITAAGEVEQGNYEVTFEEGTFTINVRPVTVTIDNKTSAYKEEIVTLTSSVTEGTVVDGDNLGIKLTTTATNTSVVGIYEIVGTAGNTNYDITFIDGEYEITPAIITESNIKVSDPANLTYNKEEKEVSVSINANNNTLIEDTEYVLDIKYYAGEEVSEETLMGKPRNAGTYTARVIVTGINNYTTVNGEETTVVIDRTFTIEKADPEVPTMPTGITAKYDETLQVVENKLIALGTGFSIDVVANALTDKVGNAGTQTIKVKYTPEDTENYNVMSGLDLDITVEQIPAITDYEILPIEVDYMTTYEGIQNKLQEQNPGWALRGITEMLETPNAGKITLAVVYAGDANHTEVVDEVEVTINKIEKPATTKVLEATFGQTLGDIKEQLPTGWSFVDSDETSVGNAGNNSFNIVYGEDTNYKETAGTITVHVGKGTLTLTYPTASSLTYGQKLSESRLTGGSTLYGEFRWKNANEVPTVNNNGYLVEFVPNAETAGNFEITNSEQRVAITVAKAIIDVDQLQYKTVSYAVNGTKQDEEDSLTVTYNGYRRAIEVATDLPEGAKPEIANDKDSQVNAGTYANIRVAFTDTDNYTFTKSEAFVTLTIEKADIDVSAICEDFANRGTTIVEDEEKHSIRVNETLLAKLPGKVSVKYNIEEVSAPGTYTIIATFIVEDTQNYNEIKEQAKSVLVIQKAAVKPNIKFVNDIYEGGKTYTDTEGKETSYGTLTWDVGTSCIIKRNGQNYYTSTAAGSVNLTSDGLYEVTIKNGDKTSTAKIRIMVEDYEVKLPTEGLNSKGKYIVDVDLSIGENFTNLYGLNYKVEVIDDSTGEIKTFNKPTAGTKFHTIEQQSTEKTYTIKLYIDGKVEQEKQIIIRPRTTTK